jgi:hypothetical protein
VNVNCGRPLTVRQTSCRLPNAFSTDHDRARWTANVRVLPRAHQISYVFFGVFLQCRDRDSDHLLRLISDRCYRVDHSHGYILDSLLASLGLHCDWNCSHLHDGLRLCLLLHSRVHSL